MTKLEGEHILSKLWNLIENSKKYISVDGADVYLYQRKHPEKHGLISLVFEVQDGIAHSLVIKAGTITVSLGTSDIDCVLEDSGTITLYMKNSGSIIDIE